MLVLPVGFATPPPADFTGENTIDYRISDGTVESNTATVTVGGTDTDGDTVIDFLDNCDNDDNAGQENNDSDAQGDVCDTDDDNDGMADTFESTHSGACGLDPFDAADATEDCDGDGLNNLGEEDAGSDPSTDDVGPVFSGVQDITVNATGYLTPVSTGSISAVDFGGDLAVVTLENISGPTLLSEVQQGLFRPGRTEIERSAEDSSGNVTNSIQTVDVLPLADFVADQVAVEGGNTATVEVMLNGEPPEYPVTFDYSLSGTSNGSDYVVNGTGTITINDPDLSGFVTVDFSNDGPGDNNETLVFTLSNPANAVLGDNTTHRIRIAEGNVTPRINYMLVMQAGGGFGPQIIADNGVNDVTVMPNIVDPNLGETFTYNWTSPFGTSAAANFNFSSNGLTPGSYVISLQVTDSNGASGSHELPINVLSAAPVLSAIVDADADGINDDVDGFSDDDIDGIPNYLDAYDSTFVDLRLLQNQAGVNDVGELENVKFLQTEPGFFLRKGPVAMFGNASGSMLSEGDVMDYAEDNNVPRSSANDDLVNIGGLYDFEIYNMLPGATVRIVLPLSARILEGSTYRKFSLQDGWRDFSTAGDNAIASARSTRGVCPAPGHSSYSSGLNAFDNCIELTLVDGGPNDADGEANGVIRDPGGVAVADPSPGPEQEEAEDGSGGGVLHPFWLLLLMLWGARLRILGLQPRECHESDGT